MPPRTQDHPPVVQQHPDPVSLATQAERLATLDGLDILDTPSEVVFDDLVALASSFCATPIALISLVDHDRQWFKARTGIEACQTPLSQSVCSHALGQRSLLSIPDMTQDPRTSGNPLVTGEPGMRFYAGVPLVERNGHVMGTLCVIDTVPRPGGLTAAQQDALQRLARQVMTLLIMRAGLLDRSRHIAMSHRLHNATLEREAGSRSERIALRDSGLRFRLAQEAGRVGTFELDIATGAMAVSAEFCRIFGVPVLPRYAAATIEALVCERDRTLRSSLLSRRDGSATMDVEYRILRGDDGRQRWINRRAEFLRDPAGQPLKMFGTVQDVTESKQASLRLSALVHLGERLRQATSRVEVLAAAGEIMGEAFEADRAGGAELDLREGTITVEHDWTRPGIASLIGPMSFAPIANMVGLLRQGHVTVHGDVLSAPELTGDMEAFERIGLRAHISVPMAVRAEQITLLFVHFMQPRAWSAGEVDFARSIAHRTEAALVRIDAETAQQMRNTELSHRLKNTLAMVQAIAGQTLRPVTPREPVTALEQRLQALSTAHDLLLQRNWSPAQLNEVVEKVLATISQLGRFDIAGPEVELGPRAALSLAMLLHELATNALKYGSLSRPEGRVSLHWQVTGEGEAATLRLAWRESGGPEVFAPEVVSFGSKLIRMGLVGDGDVELRYPTAGFEADLSATLFDLQQL